MHCVYEVLVIVSEKLPIMTVPLKINRSLKDTRALYPSAEQVADMLRSDRSREALRYWLSKAADGDVPSKQVMDPVEMVAFLPDIVLLDVVEGGPDFRFRLVGGNVRFHLQNDITGKLLSDVPNSEIGNRLRFALFDCVATHMPGALETRYRGPQCDYKTIEVLTLPLRSVPDGPVERVLITMQFFHKS